MGDLPIWTIFEFFQLLEMLSRIGHCVPCCEQRDAWKVSSVKKLELERWLDGWGLGLLRLCGKIADEVGAEAYLVGGAVRDAVLGERSNDLDISVCGATDAFVGKLTKMPRCALLRTSQFGTYLLKYEGRVFDVVAVRRESYAKSGALPTVAPGTLLSDLERRDFTINALAVGLNGQSWGELIDPLDGLADLRAKVVRIIHQKSFADDPTRLIRAVRYAVRLGFELEADTGKLLAKNATFITRISGSRIIAELTKVLAEPKRAAMFAKLHGFGVLGAIFKGFEIESATLDALRQHDSGDASPTFGDSQRLASGFAYLIADLVPSALEAMRKDYSQLPKSWRGIARAQVRYLARAEYLAQDDLTPSQIYFQLAKLPLAFLEVRADVETDTLRKQHLNAYLEQYRHCKLALNGNDLKRLGVPDVEIGDYLEKLLTAKLDSFMLGGRTDEEASVRSMLKTLDDKPATAG